MIFINKENGSIEIDQHFQISPNENLKEIKLKLGGKAYIPKYGSDEEIAILDDDNLEVIYIFKAEKGPNINKIYIEPKYSSWDDIEKLVDVSIIKIKSLLNDLDLKECNIFPWGRVFYEYDPRNLIPSIVIEYKISQKF